MTDKQQVSQMNEVIAVFDGWEEWEHEKVLFINPGRNETAFHKVEDFKYHSSWSELHDCWNKVYQLFLGLLEKDYQLSHGFTDRMSVAMITGNITEAHRILFDAISWYNKQNDNGK